MENEMFEWWKFEEPKPAQKNFRAVAYYRHSAEIGQENSVEIQQDNVRAFAQKYNIEIIAEYADRGKSGLTVDGRKQFQEMMKRVEEDNSFQFVLCYDVSRWGRFQDTDLSAHYDSQCSLAGKKVIYTCHGMVDTKDEGNLLINQLRKSIDRYQAAEYSRGLSKKVFDGCAKVARQGYRAGGPPPYGMHRLMLDEHKKPDRILNPGQRKAIQNGRVVLQPGDPAEVAIIQEIFKLFVEEDYSENQIAGYLNTRGVPSPRGGQWQSGSIHHILTDEQYAGSVVYNKTSGKLKSPTRPNPLEEWIITPESYEPVVSRDLFERAQLRINARKRRFSPEEMQNIFRTVYEKYGMFSSSLFRGVFEVVPSKSQIKKEFGSLPEGFQSLFPEVIETAKNDVFNQISEQARLVDTYSNFMIINRKFTVNIQPALPQPCGYGYQWFFRLDSREAVDITLGVPLADTGEREILGYFPIPRLMTHDPIFSLSNHALTKFQMYGYSGLEFIKDLIRAGGAL